MEYYKAYDERYKKFHKEENLAWAEDEPSCILKSIFESNKLSKKSKVLELGCGEGQNAIYLLKNGYNIFASDVSPEAIKWCKEKAKEQNFDENHFFVLDALNNNLSDSFDCIFSISTLHMLVLEEDRKKFLDFIYSHLKTKGIAIITVMGDGVDEKNNSNLKEAFKLSKRENRNKIVEVANTSCRIVNWKTFLKELEDSHLTVLKHYVTNEISGFNSSMVVEITK